MMPTRFWIKYSLVLLSIPTVSCIKRITPVIRQSAPILVVEGMVSTDPPPYTIKLSYTGKFISANVDSIQHFINDARVWIKDDAGDSTACILSAPGTYQSEDSNFIGKIGRSYALAIHLSDGKTYISNFEKINQVPPIDSLTVVYDSSYITDVRPMQLIISANTHDLPAVQNYYRWTASGYIPRKSMGEPCGFSGSSGCYPYFCLCKALCEQFLSNDQINILSDKFIDGRQILQPVFYSPLYWHGKHFIEIKQFSIDKNSYEFWEQYREQTDRTGSILDPLPASLIGNVHNQADSNDVALGLFSASDVFTKKVVIIPFFLQDYWLASISAGFIKPGDCDLVFPDALPDDTDAPGWENAEVIEMH